MSANRTVFKAEILAIRDPTPSVRELDLRFRRPDGMSFKAGQFVMLHVPDKETGKPALRAYSIASDDRDSSQIQLFFKYIPNGKASEFIWNLKGHEELDFTGPFGRVLFPEVAPDQVILLNTGTGISQHLAFILSKAKDLPSTQFHLLFGVRHEEDIYLKEKLDHLQKALPNFNYKYVLSRPGPSWTGLKGHVQDHLNTMNLKIEQTQFFLCGNGHMVRDTKRLLIESLGWDKARVHAEAFD